MNEAVIEERILWKGYPSWRHFTWLYFFTIWTAARGIFLKYVEISGWEFWVLGALLLIGTVGVLRFWVQYILVPTRVVVKNGYSGKDIQDMDFQSLTDLEIQQGPLATFLGVGTVILKNQNAEQTIRLRGVSNPEVLVTKIRALLPPSSPVFGE